MKDFRKLKVWEKSHNLTLAIYQATNKFPTRELYGLTSQIRRSASSIPSNIAEGSGRDTDADLRRFLQIALGSASELQYHLILTHDLKLLNEETFLKITEDVIEVKGMLASFIQS